jgi:dATP pyrophosphohydrolase
MPVRHDMVCCYVVRRRAGGYEFLQLRRAEDYLRGTWQTVYGGAESGETLWRAALRELYEETALVPVEFYRLATVRSFYTDINDTVWHATSFCAIVAEDATITLDAENDATRWVSLDAVNDAFMWATDRESVAEIVREILRDSLAKPHLRIELAPGDLARP